MIVPLCTYDAGQYKAIREQDTFLACGASVASTVGRVQSWAAAIRRVSVDRRYGALSRSDASSSPSGGRSRSDD